MPCCSGPAWPSITPCRSTPHVGSSHIPAVYELGTTATGLPADRIGFVTGNAWDAAGAGTFGFRVAWLHAPAAAGLPPVGAPEPIEATWESLAEVFLEQQTA